MSIFDQHTENLRLTILSAGTKLKKGMDDGPEGEPVVLTPAEATVVYRLLNESLGMEFE